MEALVQCLPIEIREKKYKYVVAAKLNERDDIGWDFVHKQILSAPYCDMHKRIVKIMYCSKCSHCKRNNCCYPCFKNKNKHFFDSSKFDEIFFKDYYSQEP